MKAISHREASGIEGLQYEESADLNPGTGEVKIRLMAAGINHRDLFLMAGRTASDAPFFLGSDGTGIVEAVGSLVSSAAVGDEVIIHPCIGWEKTDEVPPVPAILGGPSNGTLAQYVIVPAANVFPKPAYLSWEEAGVLPLSALTAYRALFTKGQLRRGEHVLIPGIGGGVATFAMLMALAAGATVSVTSRSKTKQQAAVEQGASFALDSHSDWRSSLGQQAVDLILDSIGPATFGQYFEVIKPNGRIVTFGASSGDEITIPIRALFFSQISIIGTSMGSREEFAAMLAFVEQHQLRPVIDRMYKLPQIKKAFERMNRGEQYGNIGISMAEGPHVPS
ncbi:zinc-binding dehydrogenase [Paenibacillus sp. Leaf72]|uniref:zinc-binding dehydrogenase n=1 Tax=Paenibacillus sp. Leaf72 TaxID=1736234 RepID=UPI0006FBB554|nr:zinc-binding dehydrogenase [Paenibacillus sp. Leaf72]KQO18527.1 alcohol dehydrogenase [Paenibacillus sp. Leaf72]